MQEAPLLKAGMELKVQLNQEHSRQFPYFLGIDDWLGGACMARGKVKVINLCLSLRKHPLLKLLSQCYHLKDGNKYISVEWPLFFMSNALPISIFTALLED